MYDILGQAGGVLAGRVIANLSSDSPQKTREAAANIKSFLIHNLRQLKELSLDTLLQRRYEKYRKIGVFHCPGGDLLAIEDRCSHDDGPLAEGEFDLDSCTVECPRHGSLFDLRTGRPKTLPAYQPVQTFAARVENGDVKLEV